jgi:hypothetical protein
LKYGIAGIFIIYLIYKNWRLETANAAKEKEKDAEIKASMEKRIDEAMKTVVTLGANAAATEKMAHALVAMDDRLHESNERLAELSGRIGER